MIANDPHHLQRFVDAQAAVHDRVIDELTQGRKTSHWMWFIFPQVAGLGLSSMAQRYAIASYAEAEAYLAHDLLGPRLRTCTRLICDMRGSPIHDILGSPDDVKFRSSMTLFDAIAGASEFADALSRYYSAQRDPATIAILGDWAARR